MWARRREMVGKEEEKLSLSCGIINKDHERFLTFVAEFLWSKVTFGKSRLITKIGHQR